MGKINFDILKNKMNEVINQKVNQVDFINWLTKNIVVKKYIPISDKYATIILLSLNFQMEHLDKFMTGDSEIKISDIYKLYDILSTINILFSYTDIETEEDLATEETYNLVMESGLFNYINGICYYDYSIFKNQCDRFVGIDNMSIINQLNETFGKNPSIDEFNESMVQFKKIMGEKKVSENLKFLNNIEMINNPALMEVVDNIQTESMKEVKGKNSKKSG